MDTKPKLKLTFHKKKREENNEPAKEYGFYKPSAQKCIERKKEGKYRKFHS